MIFIIEHIQLTYVYWITRKIEVNDDDHFVIGWPPTKSRRNQSYWHNCGGHPAPNYVHVKNSAGGSRGAGGSKSLFVKVKMDGIGIARKIDLNLHHSYQTLVPNLIGMFGKCKPILQYQALNFQKQMQQKYICNYLTSNPKYFISM